MIRIKEFAVVILVVGMVNDIVEAESLTFQVSTNVHHRIRRQSENGNEEIIDNIFNIPITAIRQTAAAAQSLYPDSGSSIDSVFNIPVATLEAVGNLVKTRNSLAQRRPMDVSDDIKKRRKDRKDRHSHRKGQRLQQNDPLGVNALSNFFVGNHGLLGGQGLWGGHQGLFGDLFNGDWGNQIINHFSGHGSSQSDGDGDGDEHDSVGEDTPEDPVNPISSSSGFDGINNNGYEVTEIVDEDRSGWGGWFNLGNFFGGSSSGSRFQNKVSPRPDRRKYGRYDERDAPLENKVAPKYYDRINYRRNQDERPLENKIAPKYDRRSQTDLPLENKIAPKYSTRNYQRNLHADSSFQDRAAPRRDRIVFEHRSL